MRMQNTGKSTRAQDHKTTRPRVLNCALVTCALTTFWGGEISAAEASGLLRDDYVISGFDGKLTEDSQGKWLFEFEKDYSDGPALLAAGEPIEMLKSATLEKMVEDANERKDARYRLWGKITKFAGKNFIFASYFLPLRKLDKPAEQQTTGDKTGQAVNAPNDVLTIPNEIVARLQTSEVLPADEEQAQVRLKRDAIFANRAGFVIGGQGKFLFQPDGLGRGVVGLSLELLPCHKLEEAIAEIKAEPNPVRFNVAGILTKYEGRQYLLLQKVTKAYSYGNFGK
ncbi:MAG: hypothetical protein JW749_06605 [Sedimentisphaerales bacterium]|nr:hypothetical protein [Sedimentisphaerales bacterium]